MGADHLKDPAAGQLRLSRTGLQLAADAGALDGLRADFAAHHAVRLRGFLAPPLLARLQAALVSAPFRRRIDDGIEIEETPDDDDLPGTCLFLLNDPRLLDAVGAIAGTPPLGRFVGRLYRRRHAPGGGHYYPWHDDAVHERAAGLSVELSEAPYDGGTLQIRDRASGALLTEMPGARAGDATLFRIDAALEHRVTPVTGDSARTVLAGWFCTGDPLDPSLARRY